jgi:hypothetical protein
MAGNGRALTRGRDWREPAGHPVGVMRSRDGKGGRFIIDVSCRSE